MVGGAAPGMWRELESHCKPDWGRVGEETVVVEDE